MKYIRTKDGKISYLDTEPYEDEPNYVVITSKGKMNFYRPDQVIKQADTIKELCDEFVVIGDFDEALRPYTHLGKNHPRLSNLKWYIEECDYKKEIVVYGSIWTNKGLIYVAKMNDKGELELL